MSDEADEAEEVKAVALTTDVRIHGAVHPTVATIFSMVNQAASLVLTIGDGSVAEADQYTVKHELPSYFKTLQDKLAGIVLRSGKAS